MIFNFNSDAMYASICVLITFATLSLGYQAATPPLPYCDKFSADLSWPYPGDCKKYYECYEGALYVRDCPKGTWFSPVVSRCISDGNFCEEGTYLTSSTTFQSTTNAANDDENKIRRDPRCIDDSIKYLRHPAFCHKYIECYKSESYVMECPEDFYYDEKYGICMEKSMASCCIVDPSLC